MVTSQSEIESKSSSETSGPSALAFDVQWLLGEKSEPDPLPERDQIRVRSKVSSPRRRRVSLNLLATVFVLGSIGTLSAIVASGFAPHGLFESIPWLADRSEDSPNGPKPAISPESEREANETIEAILALQELAAQSDGKQTPTQKR
jgi:hypothetical protein